MIRIEKVRKRFDKRIVLDGVSLTLEKGTVTAILGRSGSGKSTLLRCINGLETFDEGSIDVGGVSVNPKSLHAVRAKLGMVFQHYGLFPHMSALENVMEAPIHVRKEPRAEVKDRALALLEKVGLSHRKDAFPREMSGGEQQRVAIARALAMSPEALLLDEPTSALDPERKVEVMNVLASLARDGATMVVVTHEPALVKEIAQRTITLAEGRIERDEI